ncbi:signal peptidase II [Hyphomonas chukchiensis]|jgi:signal peptidase II|nr:signal peptidase II [Hyphomonas chukchiensis]
MSRYLRMLGLSIVFFVFALDLASKALMFSALTKAGGLINLLPFFDFRLGFNHGVSFGLLSSQSDWAPWLLAAVALGISVYLSMRLWRATTKTESIWIGLIIGGALGNAVDRLVDGAVTDFLDIHINGYHWPTFNLADVAIVIGVAIIIFDGFRNTIADRSDPPATL